MSKLKRIKVGAAVFFGLVFVGGLLYLGGVRIRVVGDSLELVNVSASEGFSGVMAVGDTRNGLTLLSCQSQPPGRVATLRVVASGAEIRVYVADDEPAKFVANGKIYVIDVCMNNSIIFAEDTE